MNRRGVSMILEYLLLASILSVFVFTVSLTLNDVLERSQLERVIDNQFADIASEVSSQLVDILAVYPSNGNMTVKVFMPEKIGDIEYIVKLEGNKIKIESDDGRFGKYLSLGAAQLKLQNLEGVTHSLKETHQLQYNKTSCIFPSAVLSVRPSAIIVPGNFTIDSSASSSGSGTTYEWRVKWWNGTWSGWYPQSVNEIKVEINNDYFNNVVKNYCNYNSTSEIAECEIVLEVKSTCQYEVLNDTDVKTVLIAEPTTSGMANLSVDKFVKPPQAGPGDTVELHIRLDGKGISGGRTVNLTVSLAIDSSGSMDDSTLFTSFSGDFTGNTETLQVCLPDYISTYEYLRAEIPSGYSNIKIQKIESDGHVNNCNSKVCEISNVPSGCHDIVVKKTKPTVEKYEVQVFIQKLDAAKIAAIEYLENLEDGDYAGVTEYDDYAVSYQVNSSGNLTYLTTDKSVVEDKIKNFDAGGATNIYHALWRANKTLYDNTTITSGTIPLIILMTDGKPTVEAHVSQGDCWDTCCKLPGLFGCSDWDCPSSDWWYTKDGIEFCRYGWWCTDNCYKQIEDLAEQIKQNKIGDENIRICTIGFGRPGDYNATLLENIASYINQTTKCFFTAQTAEQLQKAFRTIAQSFEVVATDVNITDVIPSNVDVGSVTVETDGSPVCDATPKKMNDASGNTTVKFNCSEIHIDDVVELVIQIKAYEPGWYQLDVPDVSNVTFTDINNNLRTVNLEVVQVVYGKPSKAKVWIE